MVDEQTHRPDPDQAGIVNAVLAVFFGSVVTALFGFAFSHLWSLVPKWVTEMPMFSCLMAGLAVACIALIYLMVCLGGADEHSEHRRRYIGFRQRIISGDMSGYYSSIIRDVLARVDRFFGDAGPQPTRTWPHRVFGLQQAMPIWTAAAYDRCLLLALIYPVAVIFLVWGWSGHIGAAEAALRLQEGSGLYRFSVLLGLSAVFGAMSAALRFSGWKSLVALAFAVAGAVAVAGAGAGVVAAAAAVAFAAAFAGTGVVAVAVAVAGAVAVAFAVAFAGTGVVAVAFAVAAAFDSVIDKAKDKQRYGVALLILTTALLVAIVLIAPWVAEAPKAGAAIPLLYFLPLLALINAPLDWISLGLSRGLLRRGLERGGFAPLWLGLLDLLLSLVMLTLLAIAVLWATEIFNHAVIGGGGKPPLDPQRELAALANPATRGDYEHWWLYAMLFSTQAPAVANVTLGFFCLTRGLPGANQWLAARLPETGRIGLWQRLGVATVFAGQVGLAVSLALTGLYYFYFWGLVRLIDATFGVTLIELLRSASLGL